MVFQESFKGVSRTIVGRSQKTSRELHWYLKEVQRVFWGIFKDVLRKLQGVIHCGICTKLKMELLPRDLTLCPLLLFFIDPCWGRKYGNFLFNKIFFWFFDLLICWLFDTLILRFFDFLVFWYLNFLIFLFFSFFIFDYLIFWYFHCFDFLFY